MTPYINIKVEKNSNKEFDINKTDFFANDGISISYEKCFDLAVKDNKDRLVLVFGNPIIKNHIDAEKITYKLINISLEQKILGQFIENINGQFLIIILDKIKNNLLIINDRFNGIPIYYAILEENVYISYLYFDLFKKLLKENNLTIIQDQILEFLWFNKNFDNNTYDNLSKFLLPASILKINA